MIVSQNNVIRPGGQKGHEGHGRRERHEGYVGHEGPGGYEGREGQLLCPKKLFLFWLQSLTTHSGRLKPEPSGSAGTEHNVPSGPPNSPLAPPPAPPPFPGTSQVQVYVNHLRLGSVTNTWNLNKQDFC